MNNDSSASIVAFNNSPMQLLRAIKSIKNDFPEIIVFIVDNSPNDNLRIISLEHNCHYFHNPSNLGFGAAHNIAINKALDLGLGYHFIVNPDVYFEGEVIKPMLDMLKNDNKVGMLMPQILNIDGSVQNLPKLLPSPLSILLRKIKICYWIYEGFINRYELRTVPGGRVYNAPILSGCFTLLNLDAIKKVGMYDEKYFMYFEDWDLSRRIHKFYKTIYFPKVAVYHGYESGANKHLNLFIVFIKSAIVYFNKWGWFFDRDRIRINNAALAQFE